MTAAVTIEGLRLERALLLPEGTLIDYQRRRVVWVVENGKAQYREPVVVPVPPDGLLVLSGLEAGAVLVSHSAQPLREGLAVEVAR